MAKTSIEWLIEQLEEKGESWENVSIGRIQFSISVEDYSKLKEQAKQMHKEEIQEAFNKGYDLRDEYDEFGWGREHEDADVRYYQETYGGNNG